MLQTIWPFTPINAWFSIYFPRAKLLSYIATAIKFRKCNTDILLHWGCLNVLFPIKLWLSFSIPWYLPESVMAMIVANSGRVFHWHSTLCKSFSSYLLVVCFKIHIFILIKTLYYCIWTIDCDDDLLSICPRFDHWQSALFGYYE